MKKAIALLLSGIMIMLTPIFSFAYDSISNNDYAINIDIENKVTRFLTYYYDSLAGNATENYFNFCVENENTEFFKQFIEYDVSAKDLIGDEIDSYYLEIEYTDYLVSEDTAELSLMLDYNFVYEGCQPDQISNIFNIRYDFTLVYSNGTWMITAIDSDLVAFERIKTLIEQETVLTSTVNQNNIFQNELDKIEQSILNELYVMENGLQLVVQPTDVESASLNADYYSFSRTNAATWALDHCYDGSNGYFSREPYNCQNFVSQCVWAGYGGPTAGSGNITQNIINDVRMVPGTGGWYGMLNGYGSGSAAFIQVNAFYNYVTSYPSVGPRATPYNNQALYSNLSVSSIRIGDILQFRNGSNGNYTHSAICSSINSNKTSGDYNRIKVCANSEDYRDVGLKTYMIDHFGGDACCMRMLQMTGAYFDS